MAKLTKAERAELEARLAEDDEDEDDESDEVELGLGEGRYFRGSMRRARTVAAAHGYKLEPDAKPEPKGKGKAPSQGQGDEGGQGEGGTVRFGRRMSSAS